MPCQTRWHTFLRTDVEKQSVDFLGVRNHIDIAVTSAVKVGIVRHRQIFLNKLTYITLLTPLFIIGFPQIYAIFWLKSQNYILLGCDSAEIQYCIAHPA